MTRIEFVVPWAPQHKGNKIRIGKSFDGRPVIRRDFDGDVKTAGRQLATNILSNLSLEDRQLLPLSGPVAVEATFYYCPPESMAEWKKELAIDESLPVEEQWKKDTAPDLDNVEKYFWDVLGSSGILGNDGTIFNKQTIKRYGKHEVIRCVLQLVPQPQRKPAGKRRKSARK